ncbi:hypothetical protein [uncultured Novosphingobium sp.]|uniref:hypothetical protein n=1 Tax=uncultured Novosphingobium sp. TaxID=292277 RepID=UPI00258707F1|nr:hypothetical protein [uncultured Novosphingobium sp.]
MAGSSVAARLAARTRSSAGDGGRRRCATAGGVIAGTGAVTTGAATGGTALADGGGTGGTVWAAAMPALASSAA